MQEYNLELTPVAHQDINYPFYSSPYQAPSPYQAHSPHLTSGILKLYL